MTQSEMLELMETYKAAFLNAKSGEESNAICEAWGRLEAEYENQYGDSK